jgi:hypothetical protein
LQSILPSTASLWVWHAGAATKRTGQHNKKTGFKAVILIIKNVLIEFGYPAF